MLRKELLRQAGKEKGPIPVKGKINGKPYIQTLVKYAGRWRLYLNTPMRKAANVGVGDTVNIEIEPDASDRTAPLHPALKAAFAKNKSAKTVFEKLTPSRQKEINRYLASLKTQESVERNVAKAIKFLIAKERFVGRDI